MTMLARLRPEGARLATPELASGAQLTWLPENVSELVEPFSRAVPLARLDESLDRVVASTPEHSPAMDADAAVAVHRNLPLTRREASDVSVFRWLAIVHRPDVVRHRWENSSWATMRTRFLAKGTRPDSNAFYRWWWMAELSRDGQDYALTRRILGRSNLATALFVRTASYHRPFLHAAADLLADSEAPVIEQAMLELSRVLATVQLEAMGQAELRAEIERIRHAISGLQ